MSDNLERWSVAAALAGRVCIARWLHCINIADRLVTSPDRATGKDVWGYYIQFCVDYLPDPLGYRMLVVADPVGQLLIGQSSSQVIKKPTVQAWIATQIPATAWADARVPAGHFAMLVPAIDEVSELLTGRLRSFHLQTAERLVQAHDGQYDGPLFDGVEVGKEA